MQKTSILLATAEAVPFSQTGDLGLITGALGKSLHNEGVDIRIIMPLYRCIRETQGKKLTHCTTLAVPTHEGIIQAPLYKIQHGGLLYYFVEQDRFYDRPWLYQNMDSNGNWNDYQDNLERFAFFSRCVLEAVPAIPFQPSVIHAFSWHTALVPALLKIFYRKTPGLKDTRVLFTIPNIAFQGLFPKEKFYLTTLPQHFFSTEFYEYYGMFNLLKGGILFADWITTLSSQYAQDIQHEQHGHGLDGVFRDRKNALTGIINGIDYKEWNPANDPHTYAIRYNSTSPEKKLKIKKRLLTEAGIPEERQELPLVIFTSRMESQKGMRLIEEIKEDLLRLNINFLICSGGAHRYEEMMNRMADIFSDRMRVIGNGKDIARLHRVIAAADLLLMPSEFEPDGVYQLFALRYGTLPLTHATGGLADTVQDGINGFSFHDYNAGTLLNTIERAIKIFDKKDIWQKMQKNAMERDYSWSQTAHQFIELYETLKQSDPDTQNHE